MIIRPKTKLDFDNSWVDKLKFQEHTDIDLAGHVSAIAVKSESGKVFDFYRTDPLEKPSNFKYTALYNKIKQVKDITDFFKIETTRIRIHRQLPGQTIPLHTDDNNIHAKEANDYRLRLLTAITDSDDFIYQFSVNNEIESYSLKKGESIIFDPDKVAHGMINNSKTSIRYCFVQIFQAYPVTNWMKEFINNNEVIRI
jgi:hypothetical protein